MPAGHNWGARGGSADDYTYTMTYTVSSPAITLPWAGYSGHIFGGWFDDSTLTGTKTTAVQTGSTGNKAFWAKWEEIPPANVYQNDFDHLVYDHNGLKDALDWLGGNALSDNTYLIVLDADESAFAPYTLAFNERSNVGVSLLSGSESVLTVQLSGAGSLFTVSSGVTLTIRENIELRGISGNTAALVEVNSAGTLEATGNAKITGNTNSYSGCGGGVYVYGGTFTLSGSASVSGNSTTFGGGVYVLGGTFIMSGGSVSNNTADGNGGGIEIKGTFIMSGGSVSNNTARSGRGGGIHAVDGTSTMSGSATVSGNSAPYGGGVDVTESGTFTMNGNASLSGNTAYYGGGVYVSDSRTFTMNGGRIQGSADSEGFTKNTAPDGAALYNSGGTAKFGAASTDCKVGATDKAAGADIGSTDETITATGTGL
ncbi:MAG: hypothetical protein MdMp014T_2025 [Treponematales bacterium]